MAQLAAKPRNPGALLRELAERIGDWLSGAIADTAEHALVWPSLSPRPPVQSTAEPGPTPGKAG